MPRGINSSFFTALEVYHPPFDICEVIIKPGSTKGMVWSIRELCDRIVGRALTLHLVNPSSNLGILYGPQACQELLLSGGRQ